MNYQGNVLYKCRMSMPLHYIAESTSKYKTDITRIIICFHSNWQNLKSEEGRKERNVLFNDALNTFYLRSYGVRHMVKDHSDSERGNLLPPHRLLFPINSKGSFICTIPQTG